jgi:hypothetical protein
MESTRRQWIVSHSAQKTPFGLSVDVQQAKDSPWLLIALALRPDCSFFDSQNLFVLVYLQNNLLFAERGLAFMRSFALFLVVQAGADGYL